MGSRRPRTWIGKPVHVLFDGCDAPQNKYRWSGDNIWLIAECAGTWARLLPRPSFMSLCGRSFAHALLCRPLVRRLPCGVSRWLPMGSAGYAAGCGMEPVARADDRAAVPTRFGRDNPLSAVPPAAFAQCNNARMKREGITGPAATRGSRRKGPERALPPIGL